MWVAGRGEEGRYFVMAERRRRRVVGTRDDPDPSPTPTPSAVASERPARTRVGRPDAAVPDEPWTGAELDPTLAERGLRGLVGGGSSQVSPRAALRARDAARPRPEDLARAEAELQVVRRHWTPRD